jgi:hypothetical protein
MTDARWIDVFTSLDEAVGHFTNATLLYEGMSRILLNLAGRALPIDDVTRLVDSPQGYSR